jgi:hypothetical protein
MATSFKPNKDLFAEIVEININPKILFENSSPGQNNKYKKKYTPFHKKINSANNPCSKFKENKNLNSNQTLQSQTMSHTTIETPEITTRYKPVLDKLNTNISSLKNKYQDLIRQNFSKKERINSYKMRFLKLKKEAEEEKKLKMKQNFLINKSLKIKQEQEKSQKLKEEIKENKKKEILKRKKEVQKLKNKEINDLKNHKINLIINQMNKKRKKEEEKQFIVDELNLQKYKNLKEREKRKILNQKKEEKKAERIQGNKVYYLKQVEKDLESKIKIQNNINNKMNRQYFKYVQNTLNDECVKNQL